jgi:hypothetical protein
MGFVVELDALGVVLREGHAGGKAGCGVMARTSSPEIGRVFRLSV